jgi:hypothetical protein
VEHAKEVNELLAQGASFYVCGDAAHMAREVNTSLGNIIAKERGLTESQGEDIVKRLRSSNLYQVSFSPSLSLLLLWTISYMMCGAMQLIFFSPTTYPLSWIADTPDNRRTSGHSFGNSGLKW